MQLQKTQAGFGSGSGSVINQTVPDVATLVVPITIFYDSSSSQGSIHLDTIFPMSTGIDYVTGSIVGTSPAEAEYPKVWRSMRQRNEPRGVRFLRAYGRHSTR